MPNTFAKVTWVTMESLRRLLNRLEVAKYFYTGYNKEYKRPFAVGETIQPKLPQRWLIRDGMTWTPQDIDRRTTSITMQAPFGVDFAWNSVEKLLDM